MLKEFVRVTRKVPGLESIYSKYYQNTQDKLFFNLEKYGKPFLTSDWKKDFDAGYSDIDFGILIENNLSADLAWNFSKEVSDKVIRISNFYKIVDLDYLVLTPRNLELLGKYKTGTFFYNLYNPAQWEHLDLKNSQNDLIIDPNVFSLVSGLCKNKKYNRNDYKNIQKVITHLREVSSKYNLNKSENKNIKNSKQFLDYIEDVFSGFAEFPLPNKNLDVPFTNKTETLNIELPDNTYKAFAKLGGFFDPPMAKYFNPEDHILREVVIRDILTESIQRAYVDSYDYFSYKTMDQINHRIKRMISNYHYLKYEKLLLEDSECEEFFLKEFSRSYDDKLTGLDAFKEYFTILGECKKLL